jgi:hypothetical protein
VWLIKDGFPGLTVLQVRNCRDTVIGRYEIPQHLVTQAKIDRFWDDLEEDCPVDPEKHGPTCPSETRRLHVLDRPVRLRTTGS